MHGVYDPDRAGRSAVVVDRDQHPVTREGPGWTRHEPRVRATAHGEDAGAEQQQHRHEPDDRVARRVDQRDEDAERAGRGRLPPADRVDRRADQDPGGEPERPVDADHEAPPAGRVGIGREAEGDGGDEADSRCDDRGDGRRDGAAPSRSDADVRPTGLVRRDAGGPPQDVESRQPRPGRRTVDDAADPELIEHGQDAPEPAHGEDEPDRHEDHDERPEDVERPAQRLDVVGRDEMAVEADEQCGLTERDEPGDDARQGEPPGHDDESTPADEVALDPDLELDRDPLADHIVPLRRDSS